MCVMKNVLLSFSLISLLWGQMNGHHTQWVWEGWMELIWAQYRDAFFSWLWIYLYEHVKIGSVIYDELGWNNNNDKKKNISSVNFHKVIRIVFLRIHHRYTHIAVLPWGLMPFWGLMPCSKTLGLLTHCWNTSSSQCKRLNQQCSSNWSASVPLDQPTFPWTGFLQEKSHGFFSIVFSRTGNVMGKDTYPKSFGYVMELLPLIFFSFPFYVFSLFDFVLFYSIFQLVKF